uniref:Uncharacterized protein n=1 Tax=Caenorhabditis japonica TaxID=281687 RepID=A0A8R1EI94_CAEJA
MLFRSTHVLRKLRRSYFLMSSSFRSEAMRCRSLVFLLIVVCLTAWTFTSFFSSVASVSMYACTIPLKGKDPMVYGYLCAVDRCIHDFFEVETPNDKFELIWRKIPESMNWCATNAQMSVVKFTTRQELGMFKVNNMLEKKRGNAKCTAVVISFDEDTSLRDLDLEKLLKTCSVHHVTFSSSKIQGLANVLKSINPVIDVLIVGPSKSPSYLLFQQFLGDSYVYLPTICQVNFAYTLPRAAEEDGFNKSIRKLRAEHNFLLMGASKDRTDMHLNLFMENMDKPYCPERYFRYFSYF